MRSPEYSLEMWKKNPTQSAFKLAEQLMKVSPERKKSRSSSFLVPTASAELMRGRFVKLSPQSGIQEEDDVLAWTHVSKVTGSRADRSGDESLIIFTNDGSIKKYTGETRTIDNMHKTMHDCFHEGNSVNVSQIRGLQDISDGELRMLSQNIHMFFGDMYRPAHELDSSFFHPTSSLSMRLFAQVAMLAHDIETDSAATTFANRSIVLKLQKSRDSDDCIDPTSLVMEIKDPIPMIVADGRYVEVRVYDGALSRWRFASNTPKVMYERVEPLVNPVTREIQINAKSRIAGPFEKEYALGLLKGCVDKCN